MIVVVPVGPARLGAAALCRRIEAVGDDAHRVAGIDARGGDASLAAWVAELCCTLPPGTRVHIDWQSALPMAWASDPPRGLVLHLPASAITAFSAWAGGVRKLAPAVVVEMAPGVALAPFEWSCDALSLSWPDADSLPAAERHAGLAVLAAELGATVECLARRWQSVRIDGCPPVCAFSAGDLGRLAKECLPLGDYRSASTEVAWHLASDTLSPWRGPFRNLHWPRGDGVERRIVGYLLARAMDDAGDGYLAACAACPRRGVRGCAAPVAHGLPNPSEPQPAVCRSEELRRPGTLARVNRGVRLLPKDDGGVLFFPEDRRLDSIRLNDAALAIWQLLREPCRTAVLLEEVGRNWGGEFVPGVERLMETLQDAGIVIIDREIRAQ
ncbi:MAG: hypothetical protein HYU78_09985 [Rhodocyclales bacterium]|nr:hypothetical protein [Rhodocyclales bacterium]